MGVYFLTNEDLDKIKDYDLVLSTEYAIGATSTHPVFVVKSHSNILDTFNKVIDGKPVNIVYRYSNFESRAVFVQADNNNMCLFIGFEIYNDYTGEKFSVIVTIEEEYIKNGYDWDTNVGTFTVKSVDQSYDVVLLVDSMLSSLPTPSVESGSLQNVFDKCKNGENPKVLLKAISDDYVYMYRPVTVMVCTSLTDINLVMSFKDLFTTDGCVDTGEYVVKYTEQYLSSGERAEVHYINNSIPTKTSQLQNDSGFITKGNSRIGYVDLLASAWNGENNLYSQIVSIDGVTENSQVDLTPSVQQLAVFYEKDLAFVTENDGGTVTVYVIGQKPTNDYTIQVTITEVEYE